MRLNDLRRVEERGGHSGESRHQRRRDREVRGEDAVYPARGQRLAKRVKVVTREPGGTDHRMDAMHREERHQRAGRIGDREIDDHVTASLSEGPEFSRDLETRDGLVSGGARD